jgi:hypothetical protein
MPAYTTTTTVDLCALLLFLQRGQCVCVL